MSLDPSSFAAGQVNLYVYVNDSPVNGVDPTGLQGPGESMPPPGQLPPGVNNPNPAQSRPRPITPPRVIRGTDSPAPTPAQDRQTATQNTKSNGYPINYATAAAKQAISRVTAEYYAEESTMFTQAQEIKAAIADKLAAENQQQQATAYMRYQAAVKAYQIAKTAAALSMSSLHGGSKFTFPKKWDPPPWGRSRSLPPAPPRRPRFRSPPPIHNADIPPHRHGVRRKRK